MKCFYKVSYLISIILLLLQANLFPQSTLSLFKKEAKPWTYWWWLGNAVDSANIKYNLEEFEKAGIGGVHIIPIYGVKGYEEKFIDFLSPKWMSMLAFTSQECERLGLGLDMTIGTGWPFGGPQVPPKNSSSKLIDTVLTFNKNTKVEVDINQLLEKIEKDKSKIEFVEVNAYYKNKRTNLVKYVNEQNILRWVTPDYECKVVLLFRKLQIQQVKRASPGGKGDVLDPFSVNALKDYLKYFEIAFKDYNAKPVRSFYHDSYEYYGADWTSDLFSEFKKRRGYDLLDELPKFLGDGDTNLVARIRCDYRNTIAELHEEFIRTATVWSLNHGGQFRNQAHGSPANWLDVYASASIPETEVFGTPRTNIAGLIVDSTFSRKEFVDPLIMKFASSAAHVTGKNLISSETGTWLTEHFRESLALVKTEVDQLFISGINHIFFHGIPYTPKNEEWPGWQFYAATNFGKTNSLWRNLPALNNYIARCQSVLQEGKPDNDLLVYFPIWDLWNTNEEGLVYLQMHNPEKWLYHTSFYDLTTKLTNQGFSFDYISDKQLEKLIPNKGEIISGSNSYKAIVVPSVRFMPKETLEKLYHFAKRGVSIHFIDELPVDVPGYHNYQKNREAFEKLKKNIMDDTKDKITVEDFESFTKHFSLVREEGLAVNKLSFIRRQNENGKSYFIVNQNQFAVDGWVKLSTKEKFAAIIDPLNGKSGLAYASINNDGTMKVYLQIESGASILLKTMENCILENNWEYSKRSHIGHELKGEWEVEFVEGGPVIPKTQMIDRLTSWTNFSDVECKRFFGTAKYKLKFANPNPEIKTWILDFGKVCESARVKLNNQEVGTICSFPFKIPIENLRSDAANVLEIEVTNQAANRIRDLDQRGVNWKKFYDINFVNINYKKFDASVWNLVDSGLLGPVKLYEVNRLMN